MKIAMDHMTEAEEHYATVKATCLDYQTTLASTSMAAHKYEYINRMLIHAMKIWQKLKLKSV